MSFLSAVGDQHYGTGPQDSYIQIRTPSIRIKSPMNDANSEASISLRPVTAEDEAFLLELYKSSRGDDLRELGWDERRASEFLEMQYEAQQRFYASEHQQAVDQIVLHEGKPAGRLIVEHRENENRCIDIALSPQFRRGCPAPPARSTACGQPAHRTGFARRAGNRL